MQWQSAKLKDGKVLRLVGSGPVGGSPPSGSAGKRSVFNGFAFHQNSMFFHEYLFSKFVVRKDITRLLIEATHRHLCQGRTGGAEGGRQEEQEGEERCGQEGGEDGLEAEAAGEDGGVPPARAHFSFPRGADRRPKRACLKMKKMCI